VHIPLVGSRGPLDVDRKRFKIAEVMRDAVGKDRFGLLEQPPGVGKLRLVACRRAAGGQGCLRHNFLRRAKSVRTEPASRIKRTGRQEKSAPAEDDLNPVRLFSETAISS